MTLTLVEEFSSQAGFSHGEDVPVHKYNTRQQFSGLGPTFGAFRYLLGLLVLLFASRGAARGPEIHGTGLGDPGAQNLFCLGNHHATLVIITLLLLLQAH